MFSSIATLLAFSVTVYGVAFDGPLPTPIDDLLHADINGWSPKPTNEPRSLPDLFRRQNDDGLCGYIQGDAELPVSCTTGGCFYNTVLDWFGCCTGSSIDSCKIATRCIASSAVDACLANPSCSNDQYLTACTASSAPFCAEMYSVVSRKTVSHLVCAPTATVVQVLRSSGSLGSASSLRVSSILRTSSARVTSLAPSRILSARPSSSTLDEDDEESSVIVADTRSTTDVQSAGSSSASLTVAATSSQSTAGAAMQTVAAVVGAAGGLAGAIALLF
ncbi:uncharacterized protein K460DRAFT_393645 [Cucurbitaria berberidis CBS 394.84]|uniref:Extracellular membrane protein CFEM domain-containing protein n=1 Tax=Cucurbitaria berberidis CBS 394.84 TaxID=1168544 RepID=A0A9P4GLL0_9PLEO|nr:uncharacterized protein K460DRAFT_393645 [Cucurbitaria berberidis CBS 394.84]KAF1848598.1 hypothetical protein K460DRAFT_393645 [Cucurbitaria berberidis CBS 394.84]